MLQIVPLLTLPGQQKAPKKHFGLKTTYIASIIVSLLASSTVYSTEKTTEPTTVTPALTIFNNNDLPSDLEGNLEASVSFAQSQIMPSKHGIKGDVQPHLTALRTSLLMVKPKKSDLNIATPLYVTVIDKQGHNLGTLRLQPPNQLPKTAYAIDGVPDGILDFTPIDGPSTLIRSTAEITKLNDINAAYLLKTLTTNNLVEINTADGVWTKNIYLPHSASLADKVVKITSSAGYSSTIHYSNRLTTLTHGNTKVFKYLGDQWILEGELENNKLTYANNTWSIKLPPNWIQPGITMQFTHGDLSGELSGIKVGATSELLIHTIDIGMLTEPRNDFPFATDTSAHREYFQTIPVSRMTVSQYESLSLPEVMLPNGTLLTDFDPSTGGWHTGTMRQRIGKELISIGIDNANYGINSSVGEGETENPYLASQLAAHNSSGNYANGIQVHGGSGGMGMVTLDESLGNEFSHEVGHNFGMGHFPGGFSGSIHRQADAINSTWGWDADLNKFIPNLSATKNNESACHEGNCQAPFDGHKFGADAMAGGTTMSSINRFTLHTPYTATNIQQHLESKIVFSADSPTGFKKWNSVTETMQPYEHKVRNVEKIDASINQLSQKYLTSLFKHYDVVNIQVKDGSWKKNIHIPAASEFNKDRIITVNHSAGWDSNLKINNDSVLTSRGFKMSYTSDGVKWNENKVPDFTVAKIPTSFGIPVTTLVGYYDPQGILPSYIYPALHGSYGFTYSDDSKKSSKNSCQLQVETKNGQLLKFNLAYLRKNKSIMNKFHINVPETSLPQSAAVVCNDTPLTERLLEPVKSSLSYTVNGYDISKTNPDDTNPDNTTPDNTNPDDTNPDDTNPDDTNPDNTNPDNTNPDDTRIEKNLSLGKASNQSSVAYGGNSSRAVDGNLNGKFFDRSVTHTSSDEKAWWQVDLKSNADINTIHLFNRTDCCTGRLRDFTVFVSNKPFGNATYAELKNDNTVWQSHYTGKASDKTVIAVGNTGRYVRVQLDHKDYLSLTEVKVLGNFGDRIIFDDTPIEENLALEKVSNQSSVLWGGDSSRAVDGNIDGYYSNKSVTHTSSYGKSWWQVDLNDNADINTIHIFNRTDCCTNRLRDFTVFVSNKPFGKATYTELKSDATIWQSHHTGKANKKTIIAVGSAGRYVRIQLNHRDYLSLTEVQVLGTAK
jgi:hypothetical protein